MKMLLRFVVVLIGGLLVWVGIVGFLHGFPFTGATLAFGGLWLLAMTGRAT